MSVYDHTSPGITGTSTTAKVFKNSGIKKAKQNDKCLNPITGHVYNCTDAGTKYEYYKTSDRKVVSGKTYYKKSGSSYTAVSNPKKEDLKNYYERKTITGTHDIAKWAYIRTDVLSPPDLGYRNLCAPVRGNGNRKMTCTWTVPKKLVDAKNKNRATYLKTYWSLGIAGKDPKDVDKRANEALTSDTVNLDNFKVGSKTYTRNSFYPLNRDRKLSYVTFQVVPFNDIGKGSVIAKQTRYFYKPKAPSISGFTFNKENGELSCTITTDAGAGYNERYDTVYKMFIYKSWEDKTTTHLDETTTATSKTIKYDATGYQALTYGQYIRVKVEAWARGYAGDSETVEKYYYIAYPAQATIKSVSFSGYTGTDKCTVRISTNQVKNKNGRVTHPTDKVTLEYLANVEYASASEIPADTVWSDSGNLDDGQCTALAMPVANLICDPGNWSYLRVVTYHANEDVLFRYSEYKRLDELHKAAPTAADDEIVIVSALPNADGESADVTLAWDAIDGSSADDATGTELSWDTDKNAWRSTKAPSTHEFTWYDSGSITHKGVTYRKKATITIKGLSEGETYYVRARRYLDGDSGTTYGKYSPDVEPVVMTRSAEAIVASCDSFVAVGTSLPITWTLSGGGLQKSWYVVASNGTPIASGSGTVGYTQIDASRLARFAVNNVVTFTVQASTGASIIVSEPHTVRIVEKPTLSITGSSLVHVHEEDEQTYTGDIVEIDNSRDVLSTKSLLVTLDPIQDLHGYDKPWSGGSGKNKFDASAAIVGYYISDSSGELIAGNNNVASDYIEVEAGQTYKISPTLSTGNWGAWYDENKVYISGIIDYSTAKTAPSNAKYMRFTVTRNGSNPNYATTTQVEKGSTATAWTPYSNICPISGRTECVTERTGKNLFNKDDTSEWTLGAYINNTGQEVSNSSWRITNYIPISGTTVTLSKVGGNVPAICLYDANKNFLAGVNYGTASADILTNKTVTAGTSASFARFSINNANDTSIIQLEYGTTATDYEAYDGDTYTTDLGRTVYGGQLDVVSGELVVDRAMVDLGTLTWRRNGTTEPSQFFASLPNSVSDISGKTVLCSKYRSGDAYDRTDKTICRYGSSGYVWLCDSAYSDASALTESLNGTQLCYELAEPQMIQLTPTEVSLLLGQNNVWSDGAVELTTTEVLVDDDFLRTNDLSVNVSASTVCDLSVVVSSQGAVGQTPTGMRRQAFGDTVYSNLYRALQWTASGNAQTANIQLPTGLDFWDLGTYTVSIIAIDRTSGLKSDEVTLEVKVNWARKAPDPRDAIIITAVDEVDDTDYHIKGADIALTPPEDAADTDVYDIYRYTGDGAELIGESFPLTYTARDLYAPFSEDGTQHYRIAIRTVDGDTEFADIEYIAEGEFLRFDWAEGYLELPYGVTMGDSYSKDVEFRKHMDGGTDGYWNENIERKGSYSSAVIKLIQPAEIDMARRLARFAGAVYVRTPEGTAYLADVQVTDLSRKNEAVMMVAFDATEVDLTAEYMLPTPYEKQD